MLLFMCFRHPVWNVPVRWNSQILSEQFEMGLVWRARGCDVGSEGPSA